MSTLTNSKRRKTKTCPTCHTTTIISNQMTTWKTKMWMNRFCRLSLPKHKSQKMTLPKMIKSKLQMMSMRISSTTTTTLKKTSNTMIPTKLTLIKVKEKMTTSLTKMTKMLCHRLLRLLELLKQLKMTLLVTITMLNHTVQMAQHLKKSLEHQLSHWSSKTQMFQRTILRKLKVKIMKKRLLKNSLSITNQLCTHQFLK